MIFESIRNNTFLFRYGMVTVPILLGAYYTVIMAYSLLFIYYGFDSTLPWTNCHLQEEVKKSQWKSCLQSAKQNKGAVFGYPIKIYQANSCSLDLTSYLLILILQNLIIHPPLVHLFQLLELGRHQSLQWPILPRWKQWITTLLHLLQQILPHCRKLL